ncbi:MAG: diacylglycerol kinase family lipid kinase [Chloroflexi bacterium]|nr:diacylglycerol kinase family lipid kinase [Chloroflexota bacterium]
MAGIKVILNPAAGHGAGRQAIPLIQRTLASLNLPCEFVITDGPQQAVHLAHQAAAHERCHIVVAAGGDGTINEVGNGLMRAREEGFEVTMGIIPLGSGNDLIKSLDIPNSPALACRRLAEGHPRLMDVGRIGTAYFFNALGFGFDSLVAMEARKMRRLRGLPLYLVATLRTLLLTYNTPRVHLTLDNTTIEQEVTMLAFANGRCYGGGFWIAPQAEIDDGLSDVVIVDPLSRLRILGFIPHVMRGTHLGRAGVSLLRSRRLTVTSREPLPVQADGEIIFTDARHLEIELLPAALRVLV